MLIFPCRDPLQRYDPKNKQMLARLGWQVKETAVQKIRTRKDRTE
jgi:hypothetical protein